MKTSKITFEIPESRLDPLVTELRLAIKADCGTDYPESVVRSAMVQWLESRLDSLFEDAVERLTSPSYDDAREFARMLDDTKEPARESAGVVTQMPELNVFTGYRQFSLEKLAAMVSYFAGRTQELYKTKLNKLLFYADFVNFYVNGASISGSRYVHLPYGPVPDGYEETLETLNHYGVIEVEKRNSADLVRSGETSTDAFLTREEQASLDWVVSNYGSMSAGQLTEISHREKAYKNTRAGEEIAYEYAKFLAKLPSKPS
jgi:uncharacterized phage-associated protein